MGVTIHTAIIDMYPHASLQKVITLTDHEAALAEAKGTAVQDFIHGRDKLCLVCGAKEPCELKDDPNSPCTFEPTPMELLENNKKLRKALAEKDKELKATKRLIQNMANDYHKLMAQAVRFAELLKWNTDEMMQYEIGNTFLSTPEVQAFKAQQKEGGHVTKRNSHGRIR